MKALTLFLLLCLHLHALDIINAPIVFDKQRKALSKKYIKEHYGLKVDTLKITPKIIVIHWTSLNDLNQSIECFAKPKLSSSRRKIQKASLLNVSAHFIVDRNGTIYRLMDETKMARHTIGLNYSSIGIENVGGKKDIDNLTQEQLASNICLIDYLKKKYPSIEYLIGHYEYKNFTHHPLWLEKDKAYRTVKYDPGKSFMQKLRLTHSDLKQAPKSVK